MTRMQAAASSNMSRALLGPLSVGAVATVLAALPYDTFDLERHAVPKELALVLAAGLALWLMVRRARAVSFGWAELTLVAYALWTVASLVFAERWWPGLRATGVTLAGIVLFAAGGTVSRAGRVRALLGLLVVAAALGVASALAQAYGLDSELFSRSRAPGGLFGNRNFMAHAGAAALALTVPLVLRARSGGLIVALAAAVVLSAGVVISRSRAAWLAAAAAAVVIVTASLLAGELKHGAASRRRLVLLSAAVGLGAAIALLVPNRLEWRSDAPYLESLQGVADYRSGSGAGRLVQYRHTANMVKENPLLGVGPGNWPVAYPRFTRPGDPAFAASLPVPTNPWPSSDWLGIASERGIPAIVLLVAAGVMLLARAVSRLGGDAERRAGAIGGLGLLAVTLVVGSLDAQLLLAAPTFLIMTGLGALLPAGAEALRRPLSDAARRKLGIAVLAATAVLSGRLLLEAGAMRLYEQGGETRVLAAKVDPGNYRIRALLAQSAARRGRCGEARTWAAAASARMPDADFPRIVVRRCR